MKVKAQDLDREQKIKTLDTLYTAAAAMYGRDAMKLFLRDLLTESERIMLGRRIVIAQKLIAGESYETIKTELRVGLTTIAKVHSWLADQFPGYEKAIQGMEREFSKRQRRFEQKRLFIKLKKKYPLHFLLSPLFRNSRNKR